MKEDDPGQEYPKPLPTPTPKLPITMSPAVAPLTPLDLDKALADLIGHLDDHPAPHARRRLSFTSEMAGLFAN